jgi:hypothetical protein
MQPILAYMRSSFNSVEHLDSFGRLALIVAAGTPFCGGEKVEVEDYIDLVLCEATNGRYI